MTMAADVETARVSALYDLRIVDTGPEPEYDRLVRIASQIAKASEAHMCFVDHKHQYIKATLGGSFSRKIAREQSVCEAVVAQGAPILIPDLAADPLPKRRAIAEEFGLRSYVGMPIILPEGYTVGVVAALSKVVGICSQRRLDALHDLAQIATRELVIRRLSGTRAGVFTPATATAPDAGRAVLDGHAKVLQAISDGVLGFRGDGTISFVNAAAERILGRSGEAMLGLTFAGALRVAEAGGRDRNCPVAACIQEGSERFVPAARFLHGSGAGVPVEFVISPLTANGRKTGAMLIFRDTTGVGLGNGVELRSSLREVARLKEQIARLEARSRMGAPAASFAVLDGIDQPDFAQLEAALGSEKADQIRRAKALLESWADPPRLAGAWADSPDAGGRSIATVTSADDKKHSRIGRWLADEVSRNQGAATPSRAVRQDLSPAGYKRQP